MNWWESYINNKWKKYTMPSLRQPFRILNNYLIISLCQEKLERHFEVEARNPGLNFIRHINNVLVGESGKQFNSYSVNDIASLRYSPYDLMS